MGKYIIWSIKKSRNLKEKKEKRVILRLFLSAYILEFEVVNKKHSHRIICR